jgi:transcriptional regulator with XRE-family HTH domain
MSIRTATVTGYAEIGTTIKARRLAAGLTQGALARKSHVTQPTISRLENGVPTSIPTVITVGTVLGLTIAEVTAPLFGGYTEKAAA